ncbi:MAG TPA: cytochrome c [Ignavibacteriaceae bacterium]|nr:cytochrome c [Ignavibacteriaceae bacterium]
MSILEKSIKEKIEDAKKNPASLLALIYPYLLIVGLVIGLLYVGNFNFISRQSIPPALPDSTSNTNDDYTVQPAKTIAGFDVMTVKNPSQELIDKGKKLFSANCSSCHGADGKGDGPAGAALNPPPRNYTNKEGWKNGPTASGIFKTLQEGIPGSGMASYSYLSTEEKFALAEYIRSAFVPDPPKVDENDLANLDLTYNLSETTEVSATIPIEYAEKFIIQENNPKYQKVLDVLKQINSDNTNGAKVFSNITKDKVTALILLSNASDWKQNEQRFIDMIINEANQDGFNDNVFNLSGAQWDEFYKYMNKYL